MEKQPVRASIDATVNDDQLTVEYWRERFKEVFTRFESLGQAAALLGELDSDFAGMTGYRRLDNVKREQGGLKYTSRAVKLMEELRPEKKPTVAKRLARQGLVPPATN